jgi:3'-phosphoadenosine 5'-phosphosulfate sulfotransferase (PAPS reductase)/FAD synthetase
VKAIERAGYLAHARRSSYRAHLHRAQETIREALALCQRPYVAFSGGKDSSVLLSLVLEQWPAAQVLMLTRGETRIIQPGVDDILTWWRERWPAMDLREILVDHVFADGWQDATFLEQRATFANGWHDYLHSTGDWDGMFLGLRAQESPTRARSLRLRMPGCKYAIYEYREPASSVRYRICPLDAWTVDDIAAYHIVHELPLLDTYTLEGMDARTHYCLGKSAIRCGQLLELRRNNPAAYNRVLQRFPELAREVDNVGRS